MARRKSNPKGARKAHRSAAQRAATRRMIAANRARQHRASPNPSHRPRRAKVRRARNPIAHRVRRRRNPIGLGSARGMAKGLVGALKDAAIGGAGSVAVDLAYGQVAGYLPASLQRTPGQIGLGDAVKAIFTYALGSVLAKPTKGLSRKMAHGALTVQAAGMIGQFVPSTMKLGFYSPASIVQGTARVGPVRRGVNAYVTSAPPLLNGRTAAYIPGSGPLLNGAGGALRREAVVY